MKNQVQKLSETIDAEIKTVNSKLLMARQIISKQPIKKKGTNDYSEYDYFTPSQVSRLVLSACIETGLLTVFSLEKDEFGFFGKLQVIDIETNAKINFVMRTDVPTIKATNITQQFGGCETYTRRYLLMSAFDIADNNLDFDAKNNSTKNKQELKPKTEQWFKAIEYLKKDGSLMENIEKKYFITSENKKNLMNDTIKNI